MDGVCVCVKLYVYNHNKVWKYSECPLKTESTVHVFTQNHLNKQFLKTVSREERTML